MDTEKFRAFALDALGNRTSITYYSKEETEEKDISKELYFSPSKYNEIATFNGSQTFEDCLTGLSSKETITIDTETDKNKLFKLLEEFYKNCIYTNPVTQGTIGGKITIIIKSLNNQEIETREFE